jgi:putative tryptophan/tyrosine transport system substrate-binding protein
MNERCWFRILNFRSENLKSKTCTELSRSIQNLKRVGIVAIGVTFAMCGAVAEAQQAKEPKIGLLSLRGSGYELFQRELRKLGYIEGKNIVIEFRSADNKLDRLPALADELVRLKVDVLFTRSTTDALAAKNATRTIPIVL